MNRRAVPRAGTPAAARSRARGVAVLRGLAVVAGTLRLWAQRSRQRRQLLEMDARQLRDIGISRDQALEQARKWFWQR